MFTVHPRFYLGDGKPVLGCGFHATASFTASKRRKTGKGRGRLATGRWLGQWDSCGRFCSRGMESKDTPAHRGATWHEDRCICMPGATTTLAELACSPACPPDALMQRSSGISVVFAHACDVTTTGRWFGTWIWFFHILGIIIPTDELIFFRGVAQSPTRHYFLLIIRGTFRWTCPQMSPGCPWCSKKAHALEEEVWFWFQRVETCWNDEPQLRPFNSFRWLYMGLWFHKWGSFSLT